MRGKRVEQTGTANPDLRGVVPVAGIKQEFGIAVLWAINLPTGEQAEEDAESEAVEMLRLDTAEGDRFRGQLRQGQKRRRLAQHRAERFADGAAVAAGSRGVQGERDVGKRWQGSGSGGVKGNAAVA